MIDLILKRVNKRFNARAINKSRVMLYRAFETSNAAEIIRQTNTIWRLENRKGYLESIAHGLFLYIESTSRPYHFTSLKRAQWLYSSGLVARGISIGKSYALEKVLFEESDLIIDCGANYGDLNLYLRSVMSNYFYVGAEPGPLEYKCLNSNWSHMPNCKLLNVALSDQDSEMTLYLDYESASSSLIQPPDSRSSIVVPTRKLDTVVNDLGLQDRTIKLLKLEAEGCEPEVCLGMPGVLSRIEYIAADLGPERGANQESTAPFVINYLLERGFEVVAYGELVSVRILFRNRNLC